MIKLPGIFFIATIGLYFSCTSYQAQAHDICWLRDGGKSTCLDPQDIYRVERLLKFVPVLSEKRIFQQNRPRRIR